MRALTLAWSQDGGHMIGLAPSAAAAAVLGEQTGIRADTLAKLIFVGIQALTNFLFIPAQPFWAIILMLIDL
jgi:AAA domain